MPGPNAQPDPSPPAMPPGPRGHWLLGNLREFRNDRLGFYERCRDEYGGYAAFRLGLHRLLLVTDPAGIEQVLVARNRDFRKHYMLRLLEPLLGKGLLTSEGDVWLRQRRLIQPVFSRERIESYGQVFVRHALRMLDTWENGTTRDVHADTSRMAMAVAVETLLGLSPDAALFDEVAECLDFFAADFATRFESLWPRPAWLPTPANRAQRRIVQRLESVVYELVRRKRETPQDEPRDLLAILVRARDESDGTGMSDRQLRDEVMTLFLAGHETTANALTWTWYLLARHEDVAERLAREIQDVLGDRLPTPADLPRLPFTEQVLKESLRLYPPAYAFGREAVRDTRLGGHAVRKGTTVILPQWAVHRDPRWFEDPTAFRPGRWTEAFEKQLPKYAWFPFGGGPRLCIGNTFAMMEAKLAVAVIAARCRFRIDPHEPVELWPSVTLRPRHGIRLTVTRRESAPTPSVPASGGGG